MSSETELKFRIPPGRLAALRRAMHTRSAQVLPLAAVYFDTPGDDLARARVALRLRREGDAWVQTLKAQGASTLQRLEHNVAVPGARRPPLQLARHAGSPAGAALQRVLAEAGDAPLGARYATGIRRTRRVLRSGGALIELALDEGFITAGRRRRPVCEIEFELLRGPVAALLALAADWVDRFGLVLDVRSKSELGHRLAAGQKASPPAKARALRLHPDDSPDGALRAMRANALDQVLANASALAADEATPEHLHQLRVGLRRWRSLQRVFGHLAPAGAPGHDEAMAALFTRLGEARDDDVMAGWLPAALQAAQAPWWPTPAAPIAPARPTGGAGPAGVGGDPAHDIPGVLSEPATQRLWLAALAACQPALSAAVPSAAAPGPSAALVPAAPAPTLRAALRAPLRGLWRQVQRDAGRFADLDDEARHRLRRRIKRLRYALDATASLWPGPRAAALLRALARAQAPLGDYNDTVVALARCRGWAEADGRAWFAVGWLAARREALAAPCARALGRLARRRGLPRAR